MIFQRTYLQKTRGYIILEYLLLDNQMLELIRPNGDKNTIDLDKLRVGESLRILGEGFILFDKKGIVPSELSDAEWYVWYEKKHPGRKALFYPKKGDEGKESKPFIKWKKSILKSEVI